MTSVGIMASSVNVAAGPCTDVLSEPFDNLSAWTLASSPTIVAGRNGTAANVTGTLQRISYTIPAVSESDTVTFGFAWQTPVLQAAHVIFNLYSDANTTNHITVQTQTAGRIDVAVGGLSKWSSALGVLAINVWQYVEVQIKLHDTAGFVIVRVNGVDVINVTGVDTRNAGTKTTFDTLRFPTPSASSGGTNLYDDLYLSTGSGCAFKGDQVLVNNGPVLLVDPCNNLTAWTLSGSVTVVAGGLNGNGFQYASGSTVRSVYTLPAGAQTDRLTVGLNIKIATFAAGWTVVQFRSDAAATLHTSITLDGSGNVTLRMGAVGLVTAPVPLVAGTWYFIEASFRLHDTLGTATLRINGVSVGTPAVNVDTKNGGTKTVYDTVYINSIGSITAWQADDIYIRNDATFGVP